MMRRWMLELALALGPALFVGMTVVIPIAVLGIAILHAHDVHKEGKSSDNYLVSALIGGVAIGLFVYCFTQYSEAKKVCDEIAARQATERSLERVFGPMQTADDYAWLSNKCDNLWS